MRQNSADADFEHACKSHQDRMALDLDLSLEHGYAYLRPLQNPDLPRWLSYLRTDAVRQGISWRPQSTEEL